MITEQDIIFDELYPAVSEELDTQFIIMVNEIKEELNIPDNLMKIIVESWIKGEHKWLK